jgi:hypothetical protein
MWSTFLPQRAIISPCPRHTCSWSAISIYAVAAASALPLLCLCRCRCAWVIICVLVVASLAQDMMSAWVVAAVSACGQLRQSVVPSHHGTSTTPRCYGTSSRCILSYLLCCPLSHACRPSSSSRLLSSPTRCPACPPASQPFLLALRSPTAPVSQPYSPSKPVETLAQPYQPAPQAYQLPSRALAPYFL